MGFRVFDCQHHVNYAEPLHVIYVILGNINFTN